MIQETNGLYLNGQWIMPPDKINTTYQSNDLTKPATQQTNFSRAFTIPDNLLVRELTRNAEQLDSGSKLPYRLIPAYLIDGGELIFNGVAKLSNFGAGWEVELKEAKSDLYTNLDRSIRTLDLSQFDHLWSIEQMNRLATETDGVTYPLIDYGLLSEGKLPADALFPAMYLSTIVHQMLKEEGYILRGSLPDDAMYRAMALPFVESEPTSHDEDWKADRTSIVTWSPGYDDETGRRTAFASRNFIDRVQPFDIDNQPLNGFSQGRLRNYDLSTHTYVCDTTMRVQVQASQFLRLSCITGSVEAVLGVTKNDQEVGSVRIDTGSGYNLLGMRVDQLSLDTTVDCRAGDRLQIRLYVARQTRTGAWSATVYNNPDNARASFTPKVELAQNGLWNAARNLPDVSCLDILKNIAYLYSGTWLVNKMRLEIRLSRLSDTVNNTANAVDWSTRIDDSEGAGWQPYIEPYSQRNLLKWKDNDETKKGVDGLLLPVPYGNGLITVDSQTINKEVPLFEMAFSASINSTGEVANYGTPLYIKTRSVSGTGANLQINKQSASPRIILIDRSKTFQISVTQVAADGTTIEEVAVNLRPCWFGIRPSSIVGKETNFCLCFSPVAGNRGEMCLIHSNYGGLLQVLRRMRMFTFGATLRPDDISTLDFGKPVIINGVRLGGLVVTGFVGYLNKVSDYGSDGKAKVTLIGI